MLTPYQGVQIARQRHGRGFMVDLSPKPLPLDSTALRDGNHFQQPPPPSNRSCTLRTEMAVMPPLAGQVPAQELFVASHASQMVFDWLYRAMHITWL